MNKFDEIKDELKEFYLKPNALKSTARHFNLPISTCRYYLKKLGIKLHSKEVTNELQKEACLKRKASDKDRFNNEKYIIASEYYLAGHSLLETSQKYKMNRRTLIKAFNYLGIAKHSKEEEFKLKIEKTKKSNLEKYGVESYTETEEFKQKSKDTCLRKYGETSYMKTKEYKERSAKTCQEKYGVDNFTQSKEYLEKSYKTKKEHNSFNCSKPEENFYLRLLNIFPQEDVFRQYTDERYPFSCDFYIKSIDTFIELNLTWTHGYHKFNTNNEEDKNKLALWKEKAKTSSYYRNAIKVWTIKDPLKQKTAKDNNLNYFVAYISEDIPKILSQLEQF